MKPIDQSIYSDRLKSLLALKAMIEYAATCAATLESKAVEDALKVANVEVGIELQLIRTKELSLH